MNFLKICFFSSTALLCACAIAGCSRLSSEAKEMVGDYYIPEVSQDEPLMELNSDGTCVIRAIRPGVLTMSVPGKWNVLSDSLMVQLDEEGLVTTGDSTLVGNIPSEIKKAVVEFNGTTLTLEYDGVQYVYLRRGHIKE